MSGGTEYVAGFLFDIDRNYVALVQKQKPAWQAGKLNAIGGKIESGEKPIVAMRREFVEETGVWIEDWQPLAVLTGEDFVVHFFEAFDEKVHQVYTAETEAIDVYELPYAQHLRGLMPNLPALMALALDRSGIAKPVALFDAIPEKSK